MTDLRALLYEPWCEKCGTPQSLREPAGGIWRCFVCKEQVVLSISARLPECVPYLLRWHDESHVWQLSWIGIDDLTAELLFIGQAVDKFTNVTFALHGEKWSCIVQGHYGSGDSKVAALAAALHKLADGRKQETTS